MGVIPHPPVCFFYGGCRCRSRSEKRAGKEGRTAHPPRERSWIETPPTQYIPGSSSPGLGDLRAGPARKRAGKARDWVGGDGFSLGVQPAPVREWGDTSQPPPPEDRLLRFRVLTEPGREPGGPEQ